jgi:UDP-3-O-[3-hydroxymyristoyl] glucosamine N-acyltransferase LpxD
MLSPATTRGASGKGFDVLRATLHEHEIRRAIGMPGEGDLVVDGVARLDAPKDRCLYFIDHKVTIAVRDSLAARNGCIVIVRRGSALVGALGRCCVLEVAQPRAAIASILAFIRIERRQPPWVEVRKIAREAVISPLAVVQGNVEIGEGVVVEPFCTVGPDVVIRRRSILRAGSRVNERVSIDEESVIGANAVVGSEGFGFVRDEAGNKTRIPHLGGIIIGSHVEIGALSVVQYGTMSPTIIEDYAKIDDNVEVGHNARIGRNVSVTGGVVIGGSAVIETDAWIGINSSIRNGRRVGSRTLVGMDVSVQHDLAGNSVARAPRPDIKVRRDDDDGTTIGFSDLSRAKTPPG